MSLTSKQTALLHVARKQLALADADYRSILRQASGVTSSKDLDADGFEAVLRRLADLGFQPTRRAPSFGHRVGMASPRQVAVIRSLWRSYTEGEGTDRTLGKWLDRTFRVSAVRFVTYGQASKVITALQAMNRRKVK